MLFKTILLVISLTTPILATSTLISVVQVFRHGQRTPVGHYPKDPYADRRYWPVEPGQLTNTGKTQHYELGKFTRERYADFLPEAYSNTFFRAESTDVDRTHMSVQCNLLGLFPPTITEKWNPDVAWSPIPVHPADPDVISPYSDCPAHSNELNRVLANETYFQNIDEEYREVYEFLSNYSDTKITKLTEAAVFFDAAFIETEFGYNLPEWLQQVFPEPLTTLQSYNFESIAYNRKLARLKAGTFLNEVVKHFDKMVEDPSSAELYRMYSGHDTNIGPILSALGHFELPYFASTIYFELREFLGEHHINIYYKSRDTIKKITPRGCLQFDCNFNKFKKHFSDIIIDTDTWRTECIS